MHRVHESSAAALLDDVLSCTEEPTAPQLPLDATASVLALNRQRLPTATRPAWVSLLEDSLACKEPTPRGADERALEPFAPRVDRALCLVDPAEKEVDKGLTPVEQADGAVSPTY